ncbi:filamin-C isoform X9 [Oryzias latipes]
MDRSGPLEQPLSFYQHVEEEEEEEEEMPATEKDLAEDAPWKKIQQNTFTRWCNEHLKLVNKRIHDLQKDLSDGLKLIGLLEVLSQKKMFRKYHCRPNFRQMKLENVSVALEFLEREHIKLVSIDSKAIVDGNLKLILGLIWTLILHYSISMPMWEDEDDEDAKKLTPKQRLLGWIQNKVPELPITNFHRDWRDGKALGALVDNCAPGLCPDWEMWDSNQPVENAREAMQQADDWLGVPQVIAPEEIVDPNVDEHSVMTYLSQFPKAKLKPGAPLRAKTLHPKRAKAYGPGIEPCGNMVLKVAKFLVDTVEAGLGEVLVYVEDPEGHTEEARVIPNNDKNRTYSVVYLPKVEGLHKVKVLFAGQDIDGSPFMVDIAKAMGDPSRVHARGSGLQPTGNVANKPTYFDICTAGAGTGDVGVIIVDSTGRRDTVEIVLENRGDSIFRCTYVPILEGPHVVYVTFAGQQIPRSPFTVHISGVSQSTPTPQSPVQIIPHPISTPPSDKIRRVPPPTPPKPRQQTCNPSVCRASGRGLQQKGLRVKEVADFQVFTKGAGKGELKVSVNGPRGLEEPVKVFEMKNCVYECNYYPIMTGKYLVTITWGGHSILRSPFEVHVSEEAGPQKVRAWGPGLEAGLVGKSADFVVEAIGTEVGTLGFSIEGPSQAKIECDDKGDGSCDVRYWPTEPGDYAVHVICDDEDIKDSPFMAHILSDPADIFPEKVKCFGPGLEPFGCIINKAADFTINAQEAGRGELKLYAQDSDGFPIEIQLTDSGNGTYFCVYVPTKPIKYTIIITWGEINIPNSPFRVTVGEGSHPENVKVYGPGVEKFGLKANEPTYFTVDCSEAGQGDVSIGIKCAPGVVGPAEADIDFDIIKNDNDTFTVKYTPPGPGKYTIMVLFGDQEIPISPFRIKVDPSHNAAKVRAEGPGLDQTGVEVGKPTHFTVYTKGAGKAQTKVHFTGATKEQAVRDFETIDNHDYSYTIRYTPVQQGNMSITVCHGGDPIPQSPFSINVSPPLDLNKITVQGLNSRVDVGKDQEFSVSTCGAGGQGKFDVNITSPSQHQVPCKLESCSANEVHSVMYIPQEEGPYMVDISYDGNPVPGSPFPVEGVMPPDPSKVQAYGPGLQGGVVGKPAPFAIDTKGAGTGGLGLTVEGPCEAKIECQDNGDGSCSVSYFPTEPGEYAINILFADQNIPGSPFKAVVQSLFDPSQVTAQGSGLERSKVHEPGSFVVDCSKAGEAELTIEILSDSGIKAEVQVQNNSDGTYSITYIPKCHGMYTITIKYGGQTVPQFPSRLQVDPAVDVSGVKVYGPGVEPRGVLKEVATHFVVDAQAHCKSGGNNVKVHISNPSGNSTETHITDNVDGTYKVEYTPFEDGLHLIEMLFDEVLVPKSPFRVSVTEGCDPSRVVAFGPGLEEGLVNKPNIFTVETRGAGTGGLGLAIEGPSEAKMSCKDNKDGSCSVEYIPFIPGEYDVNITFGGLPIPGSSFRVPVRELVDPSKVRCLGPGLGSRVRTHVPQTFTVDSSKAGVAPLEVQLCGPTGQVKMPSGQTAQPDITDNRDGTVLVKYTPTERGLHEMDIKYDGSHIPGSPLQFFVDAINSSHVTAYGPGLSHGIVNGVASFTIITKDVGEGGLSLAVEGPSKAEISCKDNKDGTCIVSYVPTEPGDYNIIVKFDEKHIAGSPFTARIIGEETIITPQLNVGAATDVSLKISETDLSSLTATIRAESSYEEPCVLKRLPNKHIGISFTPKEVGEHVVSVKKNGKHVTNSPFKIMVGESEIGDASKVKVYGQGLVEGHTLEVSEFIVDTKNAGYGGLGLSIEGPSKVDINCEDVEDGNCKVTFCPTEPGNYIINIKFADQHVPGSPFTVKIFGDGRIKESITRKRQAPSIATVGSTCNLNLKIPGNWFEMVSAQERLTRKFTRSSHTYTRTERTEISKTRAGETKREVRVEESTQVGEDPFRDVFGDFLGQESLTETGNQEMTAQVTSPAGKTEDAEIIKGEDSTYSVRFVPHEMGPYKVSVKYRDQHVPGSPFQFTVGPLGEGGAHKVRAGGTGLDRGVAGIPAEFSIWTREAGAGGLSIAVEGPSKAEITFEDRKDGSCGVAYVVQEPGEYELSIQFNDEHIPDSPFIVPIASLSDDARRLTLTSLQEMGLKVGQEASFSVQLNGARGSIDAKIHSPSGATEECCVTELDGDEHAIRFVPRENGVHSIDVCFNGCHIPDSPFKIRVGEPGQVGDPGLVSAYGTGLEGGTTGNVLEFIVNTCNAGTGALSVTIDGPSKVKMDCQECAEGYKVFYTPMAPGNYMISIRYGGLQHIVGSPFKAKVSGPRLSGGHNLHETSSVHMETFNKSSAMGKSFASLPKFSSDATKVISHGAGLSKAFIGQKNAFTVDCSKAGINMLMVGVHGPIAPCEEVYVKHMGNRMYNVTYTVKEQGSYILIVKWGDESVPGSPFHVTVP